MREQRTLWQMVLDRPLSRTARRVYADWLEDHGDPRGEFIQVQCAADGLPGDHPRRHLLEARADELLRQHEAEWLGPSDRDTKNYAASYAKLLAVVRAARPDASCLVVSPTDQAEAKDGGYPSRPVMPVLVAAQRSAALGQGCAFYSTYDWMGGKGSAAKWFRRGFVGSDFQHLSRKGANKLSESLFGTLMAGYQKYATP